MTRFVKALLFCTGLLCSACIGFPALADGVKIVQSASYREQSYPITLFELSGVHLGMTRDEVQARAAQGDVDGKPFLDTATVSLIGPSAKVQSEPYLQRTDLDIKHRRPRRCAGLHETLLRPQDSAIRCGSSRSVRSKVWQECPGPSAATSRASDARELVLQRDGTRSMRWWLLHCRCSVGAKRYSTPH